MFVHQIVRRSDDDMMTTNRDPLQRCSVPPDEEVTYLIVTPNAEKDTPDASFPILTSHPMYQVKKYIPEVILYRNRTGPLVVYFTGDAL